jgi:enoyl-CoA hydratase/carnithine racemase
MAAHPPMALRIAKRFINRNAPAAIAESIEATSFLQADPDTRARVKAFVQRR